MRGVTPPTTPTCSSLSNLFLHHGAPPLDRAQLYVIRWRKQLMEWRLGDYPQIANWRKPRWTCPQPFCSHPPCSPCSALVQPPLSQTLSHKPLNHPTLAFHDQLTTHFLIPNQPKWPNKVVTCFQWLASKQCQV